MFLPMSWISPLSRSHHGDAELGRTGLRQERAQDLHRGLHRVCCPQHLRHPQDARAKVAAHDVHGSHKAIVQHIGRRFTPGERLARRLDHFLLEPVVQVILHVRVMLLQFGR